MKNKTGLIISREYFTRVKKKSFRLTTILVPLVIIAFYVIIIMITIKGSDEKHSIAVLDDSGLLHEKQIGEATSLEFIKNETESSFVKK